MLTNTIVYKTIPIARYLPLSNILSVFKIPPLHTIVILHRYQSTWATGSSGTRNENLFHNDILRHIEIPRDSITKPFASPIKPPYIAIGSKPVQLSPSFLPQGRALRVILSYMDVHSYQQVQKKGCVCSKMVAYFQQTFNHTTPGVFCSEPSIKIDKWPRGSTLFQNVFVTPASHHSC